MQPDAGSLAASGARQMAQFLGSPRMSAGSGFPVSPDGLTPEWLPSRLRA